MTTGSSRLSCNPSRKCPQRWQPSSSWTVMSSATNVLNSFQADHGLFSITKSHFTIDAMFSHSKVDRAGFWRLENTVTIGTRCPCGFIIPTYQNTTYWIVKMTLEFSKYFGLKGSRGIRQSPRLTLVSRSGRMLHYCIGRTHGEPIGFWNAGNLTCQGGMILPFGLMNTFHDLMVVQFAAAQRWLS